MARKFKIIFLVIGILFLASIGLTLLPVNNVLGAAATNAVGSVNYIPSVTIPGTNSFKAGQTIKVETDLLGKYIKSIYNFGIWLAITLTIFMMMVGGFIWMMAGGSPERVSTAKSYITQALTGLVIALLSYAILQTVNPRLVNLEFPTPKAPDLLSINSQMPTFSNEPQCDPARLVTTAQECISKCGEAGQTTRQINTTAGPECIKLYSNADDCCCVCKNDTCKGEGVYCELGDENCCQPNVCNTDPDKCMGKQMGWGPCNRGIECVSGLCYDYFNANDYCVPPGGFADYENCNRDVECASGICTYATAPDSCVPKAGLRNSSFCNRDKECASGWCNPDKSSAVLGVNVFGLVGAGDSGGCDTRRQ